MKTKVSGPDVIPADGYVLIRADALNALLREAAMTLRLAVLAAQVQEKAFVDGLLPVLREGVTRIVRGERSPYAP